MELIQKVVRTRIVIKVATKTPKMKLQISKIKRIQKMKKIVNNNKNKTICTYKSQYLIQAVV
jgi:hypothetical protein